MKAYLHDEEMDFTVSVDIPDPGCGVRLPTHLTHQGRVYQRLEEERRGDDPVRYHLVDSYAVPPAGPADGPQAPPAFTVKLLDDEGDVHKTLRDVPAWDGKIPAKVIVHGREAYLRGRVPNVPAGRPVVEYEPVSVHFAAGAQPCRPLGHVQDFVREFVEKYPKAPEASVLTEWWGRSANQVFGDNFDAVLRAVEDEYARREYRRLKATPPPAYCECELRDRRWSLDGKTCLTCNRPTPHPSWTPCPACGKIGCRNMACKAVPGL